MARYGQIIQIWPYMPRYCQTCLYIARNPNMTVSAKILPDCPDIVRTLWEYGGGAARSGHTWPYLDISGYIWACLAIYSDIWPQMGISGHLWLHLAIPILSVEGVPKAWLRTTGHCVRWLFCVVNVNVIYDSCFKLLANSIHGFPNDNDCQPLSEMLCSC